MLHLEKCWKNTQEFKMDKKQTDKYAVLTQQEYAEVFSTFITNTMDLLSVDRNLDFGRIRLGFFVAGL